MTDAVKSTNASSSSSCLWSQSKDHHDGLLKPEDWEMKIVSLHKGELSRQITEAVRISMEGLDNLLNKTNKFGANNLTEVALRAGNKIIMPGIKRKRDEDSDINEVKESMEDFKTKSDRKSKRKTIKKKEILFPRKRVNIHQSADNAAVEEANRDLNVKTEDQLVKNKIEEQCYYIMS